MIQENIEFQRWIILPHGALSVQILVCNENIRNLSDLQMKAIDPQPEILLNLRGGGLVTVHFLRDVIHVSEVLPSPVALELRQGI